MFSYVELSQFDLKELASILDDAKEYYNLKLDYALAEELTPKTKEEIAHYDRMLQSVEMLEEVFRKA